MLHAGWSSTLTPSPSWSSVGWGRAVGRWWSVEPWYPGEALVTTDLVEQRGKTTLTTTVLYESREARDAVLKTPMERGVAESYDRLAELLASLARGRSGGGV